MDSNFFDNEENIKSLIESIRSKDDVSKRAAIDNIPSIISNYLKGDNQILEQIILLMYNLNTDSENYEILNFNNRTTVLKHLLRLFSEQNFDVSQIDALRELIHQTKSPELSIEIANVLLKSNSKDSQTAISDILEQAVVNLDLSTLLMIYSIQANIENNSQ